jgi:hypothetical protein
LPVVDCNSAYTVIDEAAYNIYKSGSGEIISGMVVDDETNLRMPNVEVVLVPAAGGLPYPTQTNSRGIYAFPYLAANTDFDITASAPGYNPATIKASTGISVNGTTQVGNLWGQVIRLSKTFPLNDALDNCNLPFATGGQAAWRTDTSTSVYGGSSARSGVIDHNQTSLLKTTVLGPGILSFSWRVESEWNHDFLELYLNDTLQAKISGGAGWSAFCTSGGVLGYVPVKQYQ